MNTLKKVAGWLCIVAVMTLGVTMLAFPAAVTQIAGLAVAQTSTKWNSVKDMAAGDSITSGVALVSPCLWNGTSCDRQRGTIAGGALVSQASTGTSQFDVKRDNIAGSSVNLAFGFTSRRISVRAALTNTDDICIDWQGGTAACPAANTAGDGRLPPGTTFLLDNHAVTSVSVIAASGTQVVFVDAWN
jgi:hypothetical protein